MSSAVSRSQVAVVGGVPDAKVVIWENGARKSVQLLSLVAPHQISVIVTVPGAFTPVCTNVHIKGFMEKKAELEKLACKVFLIATDTIHCLVAWKSIYPETEYLTMVSDCHRSFGRAMGLTFDHPELGEVLKRSALIVHSGKIYQAHIETNPAECNITSAESILLGVKALSCLLAVEEQSTPKAAAPPVRSASQP